MITIHHLLVSQSERVIWLMEELGLPYTLKSYPRQPTQIADPIFLQLHPLGQAPVIEDGDVLLAESLAITMYILELYGNNQLRVLPGQPGYADYLYWLVYSVGGLMPQSIQNVMAIRAPAPAGDPRATAMAARQQRHLGMIDARLAANPWLAGDAFTAADIMCHFPFGTMSKFAGFDLTPYPAIRPWLDRISARPAYQRAMKIAGHDSDPAAVS